MAIADHPRVVGAIEKAVRSAINTPFNVAAQRICHLYGSLGSKKIPAPPRPPSTAPINITIGKLIIAAYSERIPARLAFRRSHTCAATLVALRGLTVGTSLLSFAKALLQRWIATQSALITRARLQRTRFRSPQRSS